MIEWKISFFLFTYFLYRELHPVFNIQLIVLIQNKIDWFKIDLILFNIIIILKKKKIVETLILLIRIFSMLKQFNPFSFSWKKISISILNKIKYNQSKFWSRRIRG